MSMDQSYDVVIVGAGVAGLTAAIHCEKAGYKALILESEKSEGGRVRSENAEGFTLDRGFQVLIDSYDKAAEILDFESLELGYFKPGARIFDDKGHYTITDPLRQPLSAFGTAFSRVGSLSDKFKVIALTRELKNMDWSEVFADDGFDTLTYLKGRGFSERIIEQFFRPFFGGIFLERDLKTSASMFRFVFKNFSKGKACIPAGGMQKIPEQLLSKLTSTEVKFETKVRQVSQEPSIHLEDGTEIETRKIILACNPDKVLPQMAENLHWNGTVTQYFQTDKTAATLEAFIGLDARPSSPINNFARHDEVSTGLAPQNRSLWSVTLRGEAKPKETALELSKLLSISENSLEFIKEYKIARALPVIDRPKWSIPPEQTQLTEHIHLAGDYLTNASIDGAMRSGEAAARAVSQTLEVRDHPGKPISDL